MFEYIARECSALIKNAAYASFGSSERALYHRYYYFIIRVHFESDLQSRAELIQHGRAYVVNITNYTQGLSEHGPLCENNVSCLLTS